MKLRALFLLVPAAALALCLALPYRGFADDDPSDTLIVGAWNIQYLGAPDSRPKAVKGVAQKPSDIARYVRESGVDILGLIEICDDNKGDGKRGNATLDKAFGSLNKKKGHDWRYVLFEKRKPGDERQMTGVAWNRDRVSMQGDVYKIPVPMEVDGVNLWDRRPHAVKFQTEQGKTDLVVITVHMKSNVPGAGQSKDDLIAQRGAEAAALAGALDGVRTHFGDQDIVILGDTNVLDNSEPAVQAFEAAGLLDLNDNDLATEAKGKAPFDRVFVPAKQAEFMEDMYVVDSWLEADDHYRRLSDHYLIETSVAISPDDD